MCIRDRDRPADTKAGCKHRCTDAALRYFKSEVMEMCHREGLYQIDLLNGSKTVSYTHLGLGVWGAINLLEGYGNDNPGSNAHVR